jgi:hypothetical protein
MTRLVRISREQPKRQLEHEVEIGADDKQGPLWRKGQACAGDGYEADAESEDPATGNIGLLPLKGGA